MASSTTTQDFARSTPANKEVRPQVRGRTPRASLLASANGIERERSTRSAKALLFASPNPTTSSSRSFTPVIETPRRLQLRPTSSPVVTPRPKHLEGDSIEARTVAALDTLLKPRQVTKPAPFKAAELSPSEFIEPQTVPTQEPASNRQAALVQLANLTTFVHLVQSAAPDPVSQRRTRESANHLKKAALALLKSVAPQADEVDEGLLQLVVDLKCQAYLAAAAVTRNARPENYFTEPFSSHRPVLGSGTVSNHLKTEFNRLQQEALALIERVNQDREVLETLWKWNELVTTCKTWAAERAKPLRVQLGFVDSPRWLQEIAKVEEDQAQEAVPGSPRQETETLEPVPPVEETSSEVESREQVQQLEQTQAERQTQVERFDRDENDDSLQSRANEQGLEDSEDDLDSDLDLGGMNEDYFELEMLERTEAERTQVEKLDRDENEDSLQSRANEQGLEDSEDDLDSDLDLGGMNEDYFELEMLERTQAERARIERLDRDENEDSLQSRANEQGLEDNEDDLDSDLDLGGMNEDYFELEMLERTQAERARIE
ncbi:uncharacterized protein JCM15063_000017, partial [Sporobolomyces koalae]|uniref:uncharacterized protein n=1 Tax=Sporobolomyces koalae TaxID=500713 RepID=UPI003172347D